MRRKRYEASLEEVWKEYMRPYVYLAKKEPKIIVLSNEWGEFDFKKWLSQVKKEIKEILREIKRAREPGNFRNVFMID